MRSSVYFSFFFNDTATTEIYTLSLHDALPIYWGWAPAGPQRARVQGGRVLPVFRPLSRRQAEDRAAGDVVTPRAGVEVQVGLRSEEHTSELQSQA